MKTSAPKQEWLLLIHLLPPHPTNLRVRTWRKLQQLGALPVKNSVYVLPYSEKTHEDFQWLQQEIESAGGEASVFRAGAVEGATDGEIIAAFRRQRNEEYARVMAELDDLTGAITQQKKGGRLPPGRINSHEAGLSKLHQELERISVTDFFRANNRAAAVAALKRAQAALRAAQGHDQKGAATRAAKAGTLAPAQYQRRRWVTRKNLHIDRLACAWLIRRFIDHRPRFYFVADGERMAGGIHFDMLSAEFTHQGEDCTFETMIKQFDLRGDRALREIAEIVHDMDLKDNKFNRLEAAGLNAAVRGLAQLLKDDRKLLRQAGVLFDGLYEVLIQGAGGEKNENKRKGSRAVQRGRKSARK